MGSSIVMKLGAIFAALLLTPLHAQEGEIAEKGIGLRFLAEVAPPAIGKVAVVEGEKLSEPFDLPMNNVSPRLMVGSRKLDLKTTEKGIQLCAIQLPEVGKDFLVILVTRKPAGFEPIVVRADDPAFKGGDVLFINRSNQLIIGKLGTQAVAIKPMAQTMGRPAGAREEGFYDIAFAIRDEGKDRLLSATRWPVDEQLRSYVFFFAKPNGRVTFRAVDEFVPPAG